MGFIHAVADIGGLDRQEGIDSFLKFPLEGEGRVIRVYLEVTDPFAKTLDVKGIAKIDLADLIRTPEMKRKYLYRDRVGSNVTWGFSPLHKCGKPSATFEKNLESFYGKVGDWKIDDKCQLNKIRNRLLWDFEKEGVLREGATDLIMDGLAERLEDILNQLDKSYSHIVLFGVMHQEEFLYPGEIPAFQDYFNSKLKRFVQKNQSNQETIKRVCALCGQAASITSTLDKVFKFATFDKASNLPGLDKNRVDEVFPVCQECLEKVSSGRERIERNLARTDLLPELRIWIVPEAAGPVVYSGQRFKSLIQNLEQFGNDEKLSVLGENIEQGFFRRLAREGQGLIFHFLFWQRNNNQEMIHLMVEDVPPERLVQLEKSWNKAFKAIRPDASKGLNLDWALKSLYVTLSALSGKSNSDKNVVRDLSLKILGKMLQGERLPIGSFKQFVVERLPGFVHGPGPWADISKIMMYAQVWVEFMTIVNEGVSG